MIAAGLCDLLLCRIPRCECLKDIKCRADCELDVSDGVGFSEKSRSCCCTISGAEHSASYLLCICCTFVNNFNMYSYRPCLSGCVPQ